MIILLWILSGVLGLLLSRLCLWKLEKIIYGNAEFWKVIFFKRHSYNIAYGPLYFFSIVINIVLNLDSFEVAKDIRVKEDLMKKTISHLNLIKNKKEKLEQDYCNKSDKKEKKDIDNCLNHIENILGEFNNDNM